MLNISQVILMRTDSSLCRKELTVHWSEPNSLIRFYLQPCTNSMWGDESEAVAPIIWLYQIVDAQKEEVFFPDLLITLRSYGNFPRFQRPPTAIIPAINALQRDHETVYVQTVHAFTCPCPWYILAHKSSYYINFVVATGTGVCHSTNCSQWRLCGYALEGTDTQRSFMT